jgi:hypothetical protein
MRSISAAPPRAEVEQAIGTNESLLAVKLDITAPADAEATI